MLTWPRTQDVIGAGMTLDWHDLVGLFHGTEVAVSTAKGLLCKRVKVGRGGGGGWCTCFMERLVYLFYGTDL